MLRLEAGERRKREIRAGGFSGVGQGSMTLGCAHIQPLVVTAPKATFSLGLSHLSWPAGKNAKLTRLCHRVLLTSLHLGWDLVYLPQRLIKGLK